jgi:hypothetical protein
MSIIKLLRSLIPNYEPLVNQTWRHENSDAHDKLNAIKDSSICFNKQVFSYVS